MTDKRGNVADSEGDLTNMVEIARGKSGEARKETVYEKGETNSAKSSQKIKKEKIDKKFWGLPRRKTWVIFSKSKLLSSTGFTIKKT